MMLVYGDVESVDTVGGKQVSIASALTELSTLDSGIERHAALVSTFISASELVQGVIDAEFQECGFDTRSTTQENGMELLALLARCIERSWRSGFLQEIPTSALLHRLSLFDPAQTIHAKRAEGYSFYALYPEAYLEAAARSGLGPNTRVIGIRSIGTSLGALVAAALQAPSPFTVRPVGHPFRREVRVDPSVTADLVADRQAMFAIVDEGPGLSGSSFGAVADWLEAAGVSRERIHFFPGHPGNLGPRASQSHRDRWSVSPRHVIKIDELLLHSKPPHCLTSWVEGILGPLDNSLEDLSGGSWRMKCYSNPDEWPAANVQHERLKFLARVGGLAWLVKFSGLGNIGEKKHRRARQLHEAGLGPEVAGFRHGFIVERWHEDAKRLDQVSFDRNNLVEHIGIYLGFRARHLPSDDRQGASLDELRRMACHNTHLALGDLAAENLEHLLSRRDIVAGNVRRVDTDNRMHAWEWLVVGNHLIKTDALDHSSTHDLIGHQDISWDIAGAKVELGLAEDEVFHLCRIVERESGYPVHDELLALMLPCYLAFQTGAHAMAADSLSDHQEAMRLRSRASRYAAMLGGCLNDRNGA